MERERRRVGVTVVRVTSDLIAGSPARNAASNSFACRFN
jgi:hypothetical protein